jgi:hypothetical protein
MPGCQYKSKLSQINIDDFVIFIISKLSKELLRRSQFSYSNQKVMNTILTDLTIRCGDQVIRL